MLALAQTRARLPLIVALLRALGGQKAVILSPMVNDLPGRGAVAQLLYREIQDGAADAVGAAAAEADTQAVVMELGNGIATAFRGDAGAREVFYFIGGYEHRGDQIDAFKSSSSGVLILSLAGEAGIDGLQHTCCHLIFNGYPYTAGSYHQIVGTRICLGGQVRGAMGVRILPPLTAAS